MKYSISAYLQALIIIFVIKINKGIEVKLIRNKNMGDWEILYKQEY